MTALRPVNGPLDIGAASYDSSSAAWVARVEVTERLSVTSLRCDGAELLAADGVPLITPWFGRLPSPRYRFAGVDVDVSNDPRWHPDDHGRPLHGLTTGAEQWSVVTHEASSVHLRSGDLSAPAFPFPYQLDVTFRLGPHGLAVHTAQTALGPRPVPVAFGWHPYVALADHRDELAVPVVSGTLTQRVVLADALPTGEIVRHDPTDQHLDQHLDQFLDDAWRVDPGTEVIVHGAHRPVTVTFDEGYAWAVTWGPPREAFVCVEPLAGPLDPFRPAAGTLVLHQGQTHKARFSIS